MLPTEQGAFFELVSRCLADYVRQPTPAELEGWWLGCKGFALGDVERALKAHQADEKDGKHAPRPIDVKRRLSTATSDSSRCAATSPIGRCEYPGIFSDGTSGEGSWYCPWHRTDRGGPEAEAWIERSRTIRYETARSKRIERMKLEAIRAPGVVETAQVIAKRHGDRPWQAPLRLPFDSKLSEEEERILNQGNFDGRASEVA